MSKKTRFRAPFDSQHVRGCQTLLKSVQKHFNHSHKMSLLVICEILGLFVNTLTVDDKYCLGNKENLLQPIQLQLSHKEQNLSQSLA